MKTKLTVDQIDKGFDICSVCNEVQEYGTMSDITEESFDLICDDCQNSDYREVESKTGGLVWQCKRCGYEGTWGDNQVPKLCECRDMNKKTKPNEELLYENGAIGHTEIGHDPLP